MRSLSISLSSMRRCPMHEHVSARIGIWTRFVCRFHARSKMASDSLCGQAQVPWWKLLKSKCKRRWLGHGPKSVTNWWNHSITILALGARTQHFAMWFRSVDWFWKYYGIIYEMDVGHDAWHESLSLHHLHVPCSYMQRTHVMRFSAFVHILSYFIAAPSRRKTKTNKKQQTKKKKIKRQPSGITLCVEAVNHFGSKTVDVPSFIIVIRERNRSLSLSLFPSPSATQFLLVIVRQENEALCVCEQRGIVVNGIVRARTTTWIHHPNTCVLRIVLFFLFGLCRRCRLLVFCVFLSPGLSRTSSCVVVVAQSACTYYIISKQIKMVVNAASTEYSKWFAREQKRHEEDLRNIKRRWLSRRTYSIHSSRVVSRVCFVHKIA